MRPRGLPKRATEAVRTAIPIFDTNRNGVLDADERAAMLQFLAARMRAAPVIQRRLDRSAVMDSRPSLARFRRKNGRAGLA